MPWHLPNSIEYLLRYGGGGVAVVEAFEHDGELVAAYPTDGVALADARVQSLGDLFEKHVSGVVAHGIVDELEAIDVEEQEGCRSAAAIGAVERADQVIVKQRAVGEACEFVEMGHIGESLLELFAFDGVTQRTRQKVAVATTFDQVILSPALHGLDRELLVAVAT